MINFSLGSQLGPRGTRPSKTVDLLILIDNVVFDALVEDIDLRLGELTG